MFLRLAPSWTPPLLFLPFIQLVHKTNLLWFPLVLAWYKATDDFRSHTLNMTEPCDKRNWKTTLRGAYLLGISILDFIWANKPLLLCFNHCTFWTWFVKLVLLVMQCFIDAKAQSSSPTFVETQNNNYMKIKPQKIKHLHWYGPSPRLFTTDFKVVMSKHKMSGRAVGIMILTVLTIWTILPWIC